MQSALMLALTLIGLRGSCERAALTMHDAFPARAAELPVPHGARAEVAMRQRPILAGILLGCAIMVAFSACAPSVTTQKLPPTHTPPIAVSATPVGGPFPGRWQSTDKDGSLQTLGITGNAALLSVTYHDTVATVCGGTPASAAGSGIAACYTLTLTFTVNCLNPTKFWGTAPYVFTYTLATDTLKDNYGITWHRY